MTIALSLVILVLIVFILGQARENRAVHRRSIAFEDRLRNIENEATGRLDIIDDQISDLGSSVVVMEMKLDTDRNQGIRTFNHNYDGKPLSSYVAAVIPDRFRRSGEMYVGNPNKVVIPPANTNADFRHSLIQTTMDSSKPIVPQPFADGEPYQNFDEEAPVAEKTA